MIRKNTKKPYMAIIAILGILLSGCKENEIIEVYDENISFESAPYLICVGRNPGGMGFDFIYNGKSGGANYNDAPSVENFNADLIIRTTKGDLGNGNASGGLPYICMSSGVTALNLTSVDSSYAGKLAFESINKSLVEALTFSADGTTFSTIANLPKGESGLANVSNLKNEFAKLVIGDKWIESAKNVVDGDEPVWIIKTSEGMYVKFMIYEFPAKNAPTSSGYVNLKWELL